MKITLKPIDTIDSDVLGELRERLNQIFGCPVEIVQEVYSLEYEKAYDPKRKQYLAPVLLDRLKVSVRAKGEKVIGIADVDLYAPGLNFVFGQADITSGVAIISLYRLRQEYYGEPSDNALFLGRATKEAIHELGHTFGLGHCSNAECIMHFSNSLQDTDRKQATFCSQCRPKLIE